MRDVIDKKRMFKSETMGQIQSLIAAEKQPEWSFSVFTKLNSQKV